MNDRRKETYNLPPGREICIRIMDKVQSLSIDPMGVKFAVGSSGIHDVPPLHVIDIERYA